MCHVVSCPIFHVFFLFNFCSVQTCEVIYGGILTWDWFFDRMYLFFGDHTCRQCMVMLLGFKRIDFWCIIHSRKKMVRWFEWTMRKHISGISGRPMTGWSIRGRWFCMVMWYWKGESNLTNHQWKDHVVLLGDPSLPNANYQVTYSRYALCGQIHVGKNGSYDIF